jgi:brefeldin A-inhibited guanine nucleotide-exchange protein
MNETDNISGINQVHDGSDKIDGTVSSKTSGPLTLAKQAQTTQPPGQEWTEIRMEDAQSIDGEGTVRQDRSEAQSESVDMEDVSTALEVSSDTLKRTTSPTSQQEAPSVSLHPSEDDHPDHGEQLPAYSVNVKNGGSPAPDRASSRNFSETSNTPTVASTGRQHSESVSTIATNGAQRAPTLSSVVFVVTALERIASSKEARKRKQLGDSVREALTAIKQGEPQLPDPEIIFEPLRLATLVNSIPLATTALDCIGKLISYSYFSVPSIIPPATPDSPAAQSPLIERAIDTICECFQGEATPVEIQLQIVKSLLAAVLNDKIVVHGAGLLKAVRQTYNIFLLSKSSANQQVAQATLAQMVGTVFERVKTRLAMKEARLNLSKLNQGSGPVNSGDDLNNASATSLAEDDVDGDVQSEASSEAPGANLTPTSSKKDTGEKITLQSFENQKTFDDDAINDNAPTMVTRVKKSHAHGRSTVSQIEPGESSHERREQAEEDGEDEIYIKDAFLVFRAMCKLSIKTLAPDQLADLKSHGMRSKLLSLHLIHTILNNHIIVFTSHVSTIRSSSSNEPTSFVQAVKQYLCLSLSRNGASSVNRVFEVSCEIFWLMLKYLRDMLKVIGLILGRNRTG